MSKLTALFGTWTLPQIGAAILLVVRLSIPLVGVLVLDWPQMMAALLYLIEVWLFLTLRLTCETYTRDPPPRSRLATVLQFPFRALVVGVFLMFLGMMTFIVVFEEFLKQEMTEFLLGGWRDPVFLLSVAFLLSQAVWDLATHIPRLLNRDAAAKEADEALLRARILAYVGTSFVVIMGSWIGYPGVVTILSLSGFMLWLEWPAASAGAPTPRASEDSKPGPSG